MTTASGRLAPWVPLIADVLGLPADEAGHRFRRESFTALGGTSLQAIALTARGQRELARAVAVARLLTSVPVAEALSGARAYVVTAPPPADPTAGPRVHDLLPGQKAMLAAHLSGHDQPYHLMFTARPPAPLSLAATRAALRALTARHESLRTMFRETVSENRQTVRRVVLPASYTPRLLHQTLPTGDDPVGAVHDAYGRRAADLLRPFEQPPVVFVHTDAGGETLLTVLAHHAVSDGWSIGVLWREFARLCADAPDPPADRPSPEWIGSRLAAQRSTGMLDAALARVSDRLDGAPLLTTLPTDLRRPDEADGRGARTAFSLPPDVADGVDRLARQCRTTITSVLLSAWALAVARRAGSPDLVLGVAAAGRSEAGMENIVGLCTRVVPVRCRVDDDLRATDHVRATADALAAAVADADLPFADVVTGLAEAVPGSRNPLAQIGFAAHHELIPDAFESTGGTWRVHEGYCHGSAFDALLYVQSWAPRPRLAIEYATAAQTPADIGELAESFQAVTRELAERPHIRTGQVAGLSAGQRQRLRDLGVGMAFDTDDDLWGRFDRQVAARPDAVAVVDAGITLSYRQLKAHALAQADLLRHRGVRTGDRVILEVPRSAAEVVAVMAILSMSATYVAVDPTAPPGWRTQIAAAVSPTARIGGAADDPAFAHLERCPLVEPRPGDREAPPARPHDPNPASAAYISFTSGTTGIPKGVVVPHRAVLRLADDPSLFVDRDRLRMLRLSPLAFDASTLELFVPLATGATVVVHPPGEPTPDGLAGFLRSAEVTHAWLTSGLFHLVADHRPEAFGAMRQLFTGGGVVSPEHARRVLRQCPGLRLTNGYGPTENTTFTTVFHVDGEYEVPDPVPIGNPVRGTGVCVVDDRDRPVPPGAVGELRTTGQGLADGYAGDPKRTTGSFTDRDGHREYRTGDLVRWGHDGRLHFLGRADRQVKIAGHRVELSNVERIIKQHHGVLDAVAFLADGRLCAAVKADSGVLAGSGILADLRAAVEPEFAPYERPQRWLTVDGFPLDRNGKVDLRALAASTVSRRTEPTTPAPPVVPPPDFEALISDVWGEVLGTDDFGFDEAFFDVGGDSLAVVLVRRRLQEHLGGTPIALTDLYRFPTVQTLAGHLRASTGESR